MANKPIYQDMGNLVKEWTQGKVKIRVFDGGYIGKTAAEIQKTRDEIDRACWRCVQAARREGKSV